VLTGGIPVALTDERLRGRHPVTAEFVESNDMHRAAARWRSTKFRVHI
jgi:hypothetical protein